MSSEKCFFQDFLFKNMPVDEQDNPIVEIKDLPSDSNHYKFEILSFDTLLRMDKPKEWELLFERVANKDAFILDDVPVSNSEMLPYKQFYLSVYYYRISQHCNNLYVKR